MTDLYSEISYLTSTLITSTYSTSFSKAVRLLDRETRDAIYSIYGFVRLADEIVDTFHAFDKGNLLQKFENDYYHAVEKGISLNPVLNSFQLTVRKYNISDDLIQAFLKSMKTDLVKQNHKSRDETDDYIYGSAEVIGLMCLKVFVRGDELLYRELEEPARRLGAAFQKVNFLRDIKDDMEILNRQYFHQSFENGFNDDVKTKIANEVESDFQSSLCGLEKLPGNVKTGVLTAYFYYRNLLKIIRKTPAKELMKKRVRVPDTVKMFLLVRALIVCKLRLPLISRN
jgi:phytoene/squalene synthetase